MFIVERAFRPMLRLILHPSKKTKKNTEELVIQGTSGSFELMKGVEEIDMKRDPVKVSAMNNCQIKLELSVFVNKN